MPRFSPLSLLLLGVPALCQTAGPSERLVPAFSVHGASRLAALAKVGALTHTSILVEAGETRVLQLPVDLEVPQSTVFRAIDGILGRDIRYTLRSEGALLLLSTARERDRLLDLDLGEFRFSGGAYSSLDGLLSSAIRSASGCPPMGTAWAGPETMENLPSMELEHATFERVAARVADAPEAGFWVLQTEQRPSGCIEAPNFEWQFGAYGFGAGNSDCQMPLRTSAGTRFLQFSPSWHAFPENCKPAEPRADGPA